MRLTLDAEKARLGLARDELQRKIETFELSQYEKAREREFFVNLHSELLDLNGVFADRKRTQLDRKLRLQLESLVCDAADQRMWEQKLVQTVVRMTDIAGVVSRQEALLYSPVSPFGDGIPPSILRTPMRPLVLDRVQVPSPADRLGLNTSAPIDEPV
jgi:hypothetical protein